MVATVFIKKNPLLTEKNASRFRLFYGSIGGKCALIRLRCLAGPEMSPRVLVEDALSAYQLVKRVKWILARGAW
jgi:hypothetical protein